MIPFENFLKLVDEVQFPRVPLIDTIKLGNVIDFEKVEFQLEYKEFHTTLPDSFNLEKIDNNFAEGIVLCFADKKLKLKSDKFFEVANAPKEKPKKTNNKPVDPFFVRMTPSRIQNIMTKHENNLEFEKMFELLKEDIQKDCKAEKIDLPDVQKNVKKYLGKAKGLFTQYMKKLKKN